jgi:hypothetical protein
MARSRPVHADVKKALLGEIKQPDLAELVAYFFHVAGGTKSVAKLLHDEFVAARPGTLIRQRILELVLRNARHVSDKFAPDDLGLLDESDLEQEVLKLMPKTEEVSDAGPGGQTAAAAQHDRQPRGPQGT